MNVYVHTQTLPATAWTIVHNFGTYPVSDIVVTQSGSRVKILPVSVIYDSVNQVTANFSSAIAGTAILAGPYKFELISSDDRTP